jgi:aminoglycoside phosphotransferase (APT) family kinase protein
VTDFLASLSPELAGWLGRALPGQQITGATPLSGGYRNQNTRLATAGGQAFVLRQYLVDEAARTCAIEAAVLRQLVGLAPVPEVVDADPAGREAGQPVLLTRYVTGEPLSQALAGAGADAAALGRAAGLALAEVGTLRFARDGFFTDATLVPAASADSASLSAFVDRALAAGPAASALSAAELDGVRALARSAEPLVARVAGAAQLVHSDFNPKNLLVLRGADGRWRVTGVLDWEFAFSGSPLHDVGNMLRFGHPAGFADGFTGGFGEGGGDLPDGWREISAALDLFALADLLTRPPEHPYFTKAVGAVRARLAAPAP